jgi:uncharacterized protein
MSETNPPSPPQPPMPDSLTANPPEPQPETLERIVAKAFIGPNGIRAGWRLTIFIIIVIALGAGLILIAAKITGRPPGPPPAGALTPRLALLNEGLMFFIVLFASWVMSKIEGRRIADYGLPAERAFRGKFWQGTAIGFASITALLVAMRLAGVFRFGTIGLHGFVAWNYAAAWGVAFLFVGFFEEFFIRGYPLFTLTTGMGFWPSAILLSAIFGLGHRGNSGESWVGVFCAGAVGLVFCLILRRTGNLWMAIGFHAAWDWGETYFYGVPDSGLVAQGHLFNPSISGPAWLTGGSVGPEGSWLCLALLVVLWIILALWLREKKYPNPDAIRDPRRVGLTKQHELSLNL